MTNKSISTVFFLKPSNERLHQELVWLCHQSVKIMLQTRIITSVPATYLPNSVKAFIFNAARHNRNHLRGTQNLCYSYINANKTQWK